MSDSPNVVVDGECSILTGGRSFLFHLSLCFVATNRKCISAIYYVYKIAALVAFYGITSNRTGSYICKGYRIITPVNDVRFPITLPVLCH